MCVKIYYICLLTQDIKHFLRTKVELLIYLLWKMYKESLNLQCDYRPQRSRGKVMFSQASVILFTGGYPSMYWGRHPPRQTPPPCADATPPGRHPPTATAADGTHPTGLHSCLLLFDRTS